MAPVMASNEVVVVQMRADAYRYGFLACIQVHEARNFPGCELFASTLFKAADGQHLLVHLEQKRLVQSVLSCANILFGYHRCNPPN
jgi:hypothetical protein